MSNKKENFSRRLTRDEINKLPGQEIKEKRTESSKTYSLGNGLYQAVLYPEPVHFKNKHGSWEEIDHSLIRNGDSLVDQNGDLSVQLSLGGSVTLKKDNYLLSWEVIDALPILPETENYKSHYPRHNKNRHFENSVLYHNIFPNVDFVCRILPNSFKDTLIFKTPDSLRNVEFSIYAPNLELEMVPSGDVIAKASNNNVVFRLPRPAVEDENGDNIAGSASFKLKAMGNHYWNLSYQINQEYVKIATFPLILDPVVKTERTSEAMQMAYVTSKEPDTNFPVTGYSTTVSFNDYSKGKTNTYLKFVNDALPEIDSSYYVTSAALTMYSTAANNYMPVYIKEVLENWDSSTITYNTQPLTATYPLDYQNSQNASGFDFDYDITNLVRKWYNGNNYGVMFEILSKGNVKLGGAGAVFQKPYITINYISLAGLESYLAQESHHCGRAGTAYVGLFNGNLVVHQQETSMSGNLLPISISRYYNSCYYTENPFGLGAGWKLSIQQTLHKEIIASTTYYVYTDADGTRHHFKYSAGKWKDLSGLSLTLIISGSTATITDKMDNKMVFDLPENEFSNNYSNVKLIKSMSDASENAATFIWNNLLPTKVVDGAERSTTFQTQDNNKVIKTTAPGMTFSIEHSYNGNHLTSIKHEDQNCSTYSYNEVGLLNKINNYDGTSLQITYSASMPYRITQITYLANNVAYGGRRYEYGDCRTTVAELYPDSNGLLTEGKKIIYHFNDAGNLISANDELGYGCFSGYSSEMPENHPAYVSQMQKSVTNYLKNHRFLTVNSTWTEDLMDGTGQLSYDSTNNYIGGRAYRLNKTSSSGRISIYQAVQLSRKTNSTQSSPYTFSCYYKTTGDAKLQLSAEFLNAEGSADSRTILAEPSFDSWNRAHISFDLPFASATSTVTVRIIAAGGVGTVWVDAAQLENNPVPNRYNLLENGSFTMNTSGQPTDWFVGSENGSTDGVYCNSDIHARPTELDGNILRIYGDTNTYREYRQEFSCLGNKGDCYVGGGWSASFTRPRNENFPCNYEMQICARPTREEAGITDGTLPQFVTVNRVLWSEEWSGWHFAAVPARIDFDYTSIMIRILYRNGINFAEFSNLFLHKEEFGNTYDYDDNGNIISVQNMASLKSNSNYDSFNNLISYKQPGRSEAYTQTWGTSDAEKKKHLLRSVTSPISIVKEFTYNEEGLNNASMVRNANSSKRILTTTSYSEDKNYVTATTDARGKTVLIDTDNNLGIINSVKDPNNQQVFYSYDINKRITEVRTSAIDTITNTPKTYLNKYTYANDNLATVSHNTEDNELCNVTYSFEYDNQNRPTVVKVGNQILSTNVYNTTNDSSLYGTLTRSEFGNGGKIINSYDDFKRIIGRRFDNDSSDRYTYEYGSNGQIAKISDNALNRTIVSEYDGASRPMRITHYQNNDHLYTGQVWYDNYSNLKTFKEQVGLNKTTFRTDFSYNIENMPTQITYGDANNKVAYSYDGLGRTEVRQLTIAGNTYSSSYAYLDGNNSFNGLTGNTTGLISSITQNGETCSYTYDHVGNISSVTRNGIVTTYVYDKLGQLIRVNDPYDTASGSTGTTWTYEYDRGGNILNKKRYVYTTGTLGNLMETIPYAYSDTNWKDKLTSFNGVSITYDAIGNPLNDGTWSYTWEKGRQLKEMTHGTTSSADYKKAEFKYNANGLRVEKKVTEKVNGTNITTITKYTLHGKNIVHMNQGNNDLHFWYDAQNRPAVVQFNGTKYGYIHNLQGDVLGLVDSNGTEVVKYVYDAWGKPLSTTGSLASTLGTIQPFRYRSYVYDQETGLYYLRSRYYCPVLNRFLNADSIINENVFGYCKNNVVRCFDINGTDTQVFFDLGHPITSPVLSTNKFGTHDLKEKIPQQYVISALIQMSRDPNSGNKAWTYHHELDYGQADCNSIVRMICKTFYTRSAYNSLRLGYTVESVVGALQISAPLPITDKDAIPACSIVISKDYSHMGMTIGPYESSKNAVVESAVRYGGAHISKNWTVGSGTRDFFYYCQVTIFDYESDIEHTGPRYLTMEDDP